MEKALLIQFRQYKIACGYDCHRVLKHVSKAHDILPVVHDNRKYSVSCYLIYTKQLINVLDLS